MMAVAMASAILQVGPRAVSDATELVSGAEIVGSETVEASFHRNGIHHAFVLVFEDVAMEHVGAAVLLLIEDDRCR
jgi:hypothetical protein